MKWVYRVSLQSQNEFSIEDPQIKSRISFRPVTFVDDLHRLHLWMNQEHVIPFWRLNLPLEKYRTHLSKALDDRHQQLYIGSLNDIPMSYWETYSVKDDILAKYYDFHPDDQGVHLLIGESSYLGKGYALPMLRAITYHLFQCNPSEKIVAEPDIRNDKMIHIFEKSGYQIHDSIQLPDKQAALMFCRRDDFMKRWSQYDSSN